MSSLPRIGPVIILLGVCQLVSCGGNPNNPSPSLLALACPNSVILEATFPAGAVASFDLPSARSGRAPYTTECSPAPGSIFPLGPTRVTCTATDADLAQASCSFTLEVRVSRTLARQRFVAFGDSITAGTLSRESLILVPVDRPDSYPFKLEQMLRERYPAQDIVVSNKGFGGERLDEGVRRLPSVLDSERPEVLLLLEGVVEVRRIPAATNVRHLRTMISDARQRGVEVILATVMPVGARLEAREPGITAAIRALNIEIARLATEFDLGPPVDLFAVFEAHPGLLGPDGLHPTVDGYTMIAEAFRDAILMRYDKRTEFTMRAHPNTRRTLR